MAKKKKDLDENQEEFNENSGNEFGDDDENFGLPEVEYQPLDRDKEEGEKEEKKEDKGTKKPSKKTTKKKKDEPDFVFDTTSDVAEESSSPEDFDLEYADVNEPPEGGDDKKTESKSMGPVILTLIILVVVIGGVLGYIFWYAPMQEQKKYDAAIEAGDTAMGERKYQEAITSYEEAKTLRPAESYPNEQIKNAQQAINAALERQKAEAEAAARAEEEARLAAEAEKAANPEPGTVERLTERTGRYYVVVSSSVDGDLAMDFANRLSKNGVGVQVLSPIGKTPYHRVTILSKETYNDAQAEADKLKADYRNAWVVKY